MLLALDGISGNSLEDISIDKETKLSNAVRGNDCIESESVIFINGQQNKAIFRDYAAAGRNVGEKYMVWIPVKEKGDGE